jgi:hypothetical protein
MHRSSNAALKRRDRPDSIAVPKMYSDWTNIDHVLVIEPPMFLRPLCAAYAGDHLIHF